MSTIPLSLPPLGENIQTRSLAPEIEHLQRLELIRVYRWVHGLFEKEPELLGVRHRSNKGIMYLVLDESHAHKSPDPEKVIDKLKDSIDEVNEAIRQNDNLILRYILETMDEKCSRRLSREFYKLDFNELAEDLFSQKGFLETLAILEDQHALNQSTTVVAKPKKSPRL